MTRHDTERVRDETSGIGPGSSGCRDGVGTGRGTSHNTCHSLRPRQLSWNVGRLIAPTTIPIACTPMAKDMSWIDGDPGMQQLSQPPTTTAVVERWTTHRTDNGPHSLNPQGKRRVMD